MSLRALALSATIVCIAASASAAPNSGDRDEKRRGHAYGLQLQQANDDLASHARSASWLALSDRPLGHSISIDRQPRGRAHVHTHFHGWKPGKGPRPVSAIPEPTGALLFGAGFALAALRLRRVR